MRQGHPLASVNFRSAEEVRRYPWVLPGAETPLRGYWSAMMHACGELPEVSIECGSVLTIRELLLETAMLTLLSRDQLRVEIEAGLHLTLPLLLAIERTIGKIGRASWRDRVCAYV